ncbi:MAG TPA: hypothetical protein VF973_09830 [Myxococcales bacterium]
MRKPRGITLMTVLIFVALAAGVYCLFAFGQAFWDNLEVNGILRQAANECYRQPDDQAVRQLILNKLHMSFDVAGEDKVGRSEVRMPLVFDEGDLQIQRTQVPKYVNIWFTYQRKVTLPLVNQERTLTFNDHAEQDLSPVRW